MKTKLVIFDCDGVLVDSEPISNRIIANYLTKHGLPTSQQQAIELFAGGSLSKIGEYFQAQMGKAIDPDFENTYRDQCKTAFAEELESVAGVKEMLQQIPIPKCVGSNGPLYKIKFNLNKTGLSSFFGDKLYSAYDIKRWKPEPHLYLHAAQEMGVSPDDCVVVEDSLHGVEAAIAAGMKVFGFTGTKKASILKAAGAIPFDHMDQLADLINNN